MAYTKYSLTPANNTAAPPDGAPEGMLPSAVNDTMRDMMAQIRDVGDGIRNGTYTMTTPVITGGSITGVTFSSIVVTGGSINNTTIGASTATTATFTTATVTKVEDSQGGVLAPISSVMRNRIINGDMRINQRGFSGSITDTGAVTYALDRWSAYGSVTAKFSVAQSSTAPTGFNNSLLVTSSSSYTVGAGEFFLINQPIEGFNTADLGWGTASAKTVTLSFQVYSSLTGTFGGSITNSGNSRSYPFTYTVSSANTWTSISVTIAGDTSGTWLTTNGIGLFVRFGLGVGSTFSGTAGAWAAAAYYSATGATSVVGTNGATFYITGVQLEKGTQATSFEYKQYQQELALCQRYFTNTSIVGFGGPTNSTYNNIYALTFPTTMRAAPTVTYTSTSFAGNVSSITTTNITISSANINFTNNATGSGTGEGTLNATAEL